MCLGSEKANINHSSALAGWRNLNNPITAGCVSQEAASETDVSVLVFIMEHPWDEQQWRGGEEAG